MTLRSLALTATTAIVLIGCASQKRINQLEVQVADQQERIGDLTAANYGYIVQIDVLQQTVAELEASNDALSEYYDSLLADFGPLMKSGDVELIVYPNRMVIALSSDVTFATGSARIDPNAQPPLEQLAKLMKRHPNWTFQVQGHTDPRPIANSEYANNWELGAARAITVVDALAKAGVPENSLSAATFADTALMSDNDDPRGYQANRRIEIVLNPTVDDFPVHQALLDRARAAGVAVIADGYDRTSPSVASP